MEMKRNLRKLWLNLHRKLKFFYQPIYSREYQLTETQSKAVRIIKKTVDCQHAELLAQGNMRYITTPTLLIEIKFPGEVKDAWPSVIIDNGEIQQHCEISFKEANDIMKKWNTRVAVLVTERRAKLEENSSNALDKILETINKSNGEISSK